MTRHFFVSTYACCTDSLNSRDVFVKARIRGVHAVGVKRHTPRYVLAFSVAFSIFALGNSTTKAETVSVIPAAPTSSGISAAASSAGAVDPAIASALVAEKLSDPRIGPNVSAYVIDANTKEVLVDIASDKAMLPASTLKTYTAIAALQALGSQTRFATRVMQEGTTLTLVGGGDPTLVSETPTNWRGKPPGSEQPPSLDQLADKTVAALGTTTEVFTVQFDDSLFVGPTEHDSWPSMYVKTGEVAALQGLSMDFGINDTEAVMKDPAKSAANYFVEALVARGIQATLSDRGVSSPQAIELTRIESATMIDIVERMITTSNNTMAEFLLHHIGGTQGDYSFAGGAKATTELISQTGIDTTSLDIHDGSGLSHSNKTSARSLVSAVSYANSGPNESWAAITGLPIAGISGTLSDRYGEGELGRGTVRAKTGTLTGVVALSGTLVTTDGDVLIFALIANDIPTNVVQGEAVLDGAIKALVQCGCRVA